MKNRILFSGFGLSLSLCATGCATIVTGGGPEQKIRVSSEPRGANVLIDGVDRGVTPMSVSLTRKDHHALRIMMPGYVTYEKEVRSGFNGWFLGNLILGGLIGMVVDLGSGAVTGLSPDDVSPKLTPQSSTINPR